MSARENAWPTSKGAPARLLSRLSARRCSQRPRDRLKGLLGRTDEQRVVHGAMAPTANRNARPRRYPIVVVILLIAGIGLSGCGTGDEPGALDQAGSTS